MGIKLIKKIPTADEIIQAFPLSDVAKVRVEKDRQEVKDILGGKDSRLLLVIGPCSAWPEPAMLEYAARLKSLEEKFLDKIKLVLRVYIQKPRTAKGWTGPVNQPDPFLPPDIEKGALYSRRLMVQVIEMGLPIADEALFTHNARGFIELLSWVAIGARSTEDQEHRVFASAVDCAVGMKNPTSGDLSVAVNSIIAAQNPHTAVFDGYQVETHGNEFAHLVLRGGVLGSNYDILTLEAVHKLFDKNSIKNPAIIVDASHDNSKINGRKDPLAQEKVICTVLDSLNTRGDLRPLVKGFMVESFLKCGNQSIERLKPEAVDYGGLSITDPCIGWQETERLIRSLAGQL